MAPLSKAELDQLWALAKGHTPGSRGEFPVTLRAMVDTFAVTMTVTPIRIEMKMPLMTVAFDRKRSK